MPEKNLPEVREKIGLMDRLFSYRYEDLITEGEEYRDKARQVLAGAERVANENEVEKIRLDKKEEELAHREEVVIAKEQGAEKLVESARKTYENAVNMATKVGQEMNKVEEIKQALRTMLEGLIEKGADQEQLQSVLDMLNKLRSEPTAERKITEDLLKRDDYIKEAVIALKQKAKDMKYAIEQRRGITNENYCGYDASNIRNIKANLRAALVAIVMFYRDTLEDVEGVTLNINGETCAKFLYEQIEKIKAETNSIIQTEYGPSEEGLKIMRDVYVGLADSLGYNSNRDNKDVLHGECDSIYGVDNYIGMCIARECHEQTGRCFSLEESGQKTNKSRTTLDVTVPSELEVKINETAKIIDDWER